MSRLGGMLQCLAGFLLGLLPAMTPHLIGDGWIGRPSGIFMGVAGAIVPALASLYSWDRHPRIAGGIIGGIAVVGGPLNPMLTACSIHGLWPW